MYTRLFQNRTRNNYREILNAAIAETLAMPETSVYKSICNQLTDIKENVVSKNLAFTEDEIFSRYTLGAIAVRNFDLEEDEYAQKLSDVFGGSIDYHQMPEE